MPPSLPLFATTDQRLSLTMRRYLLLSVTVFALLLTACDTFVEDVREPNDEVNAQELTSPTDVEFLITGVQAAWADAYGELTVVASLTSDQFRFGTNGDATFPTFRDLDEGQIGLANNSNDALNSFLGQYRRLADDAVDAANTVEFGDEPAITQDEALFRANLHAANARFIYAAYMGLNPREGGGVIAESEFIPSPAMYDSARVKFEQARSFASTPRQNKFVASAEARSALYAGTEFGTDAGGYENALERAATLAQDGLAMGDDPIQVKFSIQEQNPWFNDGGPGRTQVVAQDGELNSNVDTYEDPDAVRSFPEIVDNNPAESSRIPLEGMDADGAYGVPDSAAIEFGQGKYQSEDSPVNFLSWQENHLIRAELELRGFDAGGDSGANASDALDFVNDVRSSFGLSDLSSVDLETIADERDRTLFANGDRLVDQRRFDASILDWHLVDDGPRTTTWQHLPINQQERSANPNL